MVNSGINRTSVTCGSGQYRIHNTLHTGPDIMAAMLVMQVPSCVSTYRTS